MSTSCSYTIIPTVPLSRSIIKSGLRLWLLAALFATVSCDIYPVTVMGRMITMLSSVLGIAIVALPAGIITAGYMSEIRKNEAEDSNVGIPVYLGKSQIQTPPSSQVSKE